MTRPPTPAELLTYLAQHTGTEGYHRLHPGLLATDGAKYLADAAGAYWLLDIVWSVLPKIEDEFAVLELSLEAGTSRAEVVIHDGREPRTVYHRQAIPYTDFPLPKVKLYIQENGLEPYGEAEVSVRQLEALLGVSHRPATDALRKFKHDLSKLH